MTHLEILTAFETEIGVVNDVFEKPSTDDSLFWLNQAVNKFIKTRVNGDITHRTAFELTEKRRNDLINLFSTMAISSKDMLKSSSHPSYNLYRVEFPKDFFYELDENVIIADTNDKYQMDTCVFECTRDSFMYRINNSLTDFHYKYHRARPIRVRTDYGCDLLTDKHYKIYKYILGYLRKPNEITLENPFSEYTDFNESVIYEIIKIAALMYLENTESKRYENISKEVLTQE